MLASGDREHSPDCRQPRMIRWGLTGAHAPSALSDQTCKEAHQNVHVVTSAFTLRSRDYYSVNAIQGKGFGLKTEFDHC